MMWAALGGTTLPLEGTPEGRREAGALRRTISELLADAEQDVFLKTVLNPKFADMRPVVTSKGRVGMLDAVIKYLADRLNNQPGDVIKELLKAGNQVPERLATLGLEAYSPQLLKAFDELGEFDKRWIVNKIAYNFDLVLTRTSGPQPDWSLAQLNNGIVVNRRQQLRNENLQRTSLFTRWRLAQSKHQHRIDHVKDLSMGVMFHSLLAEIADELGVRDPNEPVEITAPVPEADTPGL